MVDYTRALVEQYGFDVLKLKGGVLPPREELRTVKLLREAFPNFQIRFDP